MLDPAVEPRADTPSGLGADATVGGNAEHRDLAEPAPAGVVAADVDENLHGRRELAVQRTTIEPADRGKRFEPGRYLGRTVGVHGPRPAVVPGVQCGE
jgi:hypothetical protein